MTPVGAAPGTRPDRSNAPPVGPAPEPRLPAIRRDRLDNGLSLVMLPTARVPVVELEIVVGAGSTLDGPGRAGLADLTAQLLPEGAAGLGAMELAARMAGIGARLTVGAEYDAARARLSVLRSRAGEALALLADLLLRPTFPDDEVERLRAEREVDLLRTTDDPAFVASRAFDLELYGLDHPYGAPEEGTIASVRGLARDAFVELYRLAYRPSNATLIAVGDFDPALLRRAVEAAFGAWEGPAPEAPDLTPPAAPARGVVLVDRPGSYQSELRVGHVGVAFAHPDAIPLRVLNHLLGGAFLSRINLNLRERRGWTYGARSAFGMRKGPGPFVVSTSVGTPVTRPAVEEIRGELERLVEGPVEESERALALNGITLGLPLLFQTPGQIADRVRQIVVHDLPDDWWDGIQARYRAVSLDDLERVARTHVRPAELLCVVVTDAEAAREELSAVGPVTQRSWKVTV